MKQDPDLAEAMKAMRYQARRLRTLQRMLAEPENPASFARMASVSTELAELQEAFNLRGEKLRMADDRRLAGRALLLVTEEADRLESRNKRRPTYHQLLDAARIASDRCAAQRAETAAEAELAAHARKIATHNAAAMSSAVTYLEASAS